MTESLVYRAPQILLDDLGITEPEDIDVEAIGEYVGATVVYERLQGCEARIVGTSRRAIITVDQAAPRARQRFSVGHELGHWMHDRGTVAFACDADTVSGPWDELHDPEARANRYAANLLLPAKMFKPRAAGRQMVFETVRVLATTFGTSLTATAIRLVEHGPFPAMLVCNDKTGRKWFVRGPDLPESLWPLDSPGRNTVAYDLLNGVDAHSPEDVYADQWLARTERHSYRLREDSIAGPRTQVLSMLWWVNEDPLRELADEDERRTARRSDWRDD
jgi:Zn-dependent peptidase ImmA (M78 family)